jgi:HlyD family secretion protein
MRLLKNSRLLATVALVVMILAVALWPRTIVVDVARVERGHLQVTIDEEGETRVRERFVVSAPVAGRAERIELEPGEPVTRGKTVVARLTSAPAPLIDTRSQVELSAAIESATAAVGQARAERDRAASAQQRAESAARRLETLLEAGAISKDELEVAQTTLRTSQESKRAAEFAVARAEYELQVARARVRPSNAGGRSVEIVAPVDGVVLKRLRESASVVPVGEPLLEIGDPTSLEIVSDLLSTDAVRVSKGDPVLIEEWGGNRALDGRVRLVEPSGFMKLSALGVEEQRVNVIVDFASATEAKKLGDGYRVEVRIVIWRDDAVLKVRVASLFRRGTDWAVFVLQDGRARLRLVRIGQRNDREAQLIEGLAEGEMVIMFPPDTLSDGARVVPRQSEDGNLPE